MVVTKPAPFARGVDLEPWEARGVKILQADARYVELPETYFDTVISISALEHFGLHLSKGRVVLEDEKASFDALANISKSVAPGGTMLLTFPYGKSYVIEDEMVLVFDEARLSTLIESSGMRLVSIDYFRNNFPNGLEVGTSEQMEKGDYGDFGRYAIACVRLEKAR